MINSIEFKFGSFGAGNINLVINVCCNCLPLWENTYYEMVKAPARYVGWSARWAH